MERKSLLAKAMKDIFKVWLKLGGWMAEEF
jgi:hypothetical protein